VSPWFKKGIIMPGKYFDELEVGMKFKHAGRTVTEMDNVLFSALTMNPSRCTSTKISRLRRNLVSDW
jgi:acyl dehydratase